MQYTTVDSKYGYLKKLFCQDFKDTFVCNTQPTGSDWLRLAGCFVRISKIHLYAIHNLFLTHHLAKRVVLSGFQRYICMQYTTFGMLP